MKKSYWLLIILMVCISACRPAVPEAQAEPEVVFGEIQNIESVHALTSSAWPGEIKVVIKGLLPDACTEVDKVTSNHIGDFFDIKIFTRRENKAACSLVEVPFETELFLDTGELDYGEYRIQAYDSFAVFGLELPPEPEDSYG